MILEDIAEALRVLADLVHFRVGWLFANMTIVFEFDNLFESFDCVEV